MTCSKRKIWLYFIASPLVRCNNLISQSWNLLAIPCCTLHDSSMYLYFFFPSYAIVILICNSCNFQYRDTVRQFIKGTDGFSGALAECLCGSPNLYQVIQAVNLIICCSGQMVCYVNLSLRLTSLFLLLKSISFLSSFIMFKSWLQRPASGAVLIDNWLGSETYIYAFLNLIFGI